MTWHEEIMRPPQARVLRQLGPALAQRGFYSEAAPPLRSTSATVALSTWTGSAASELDRAGWPRVG